MPGEEKLHALTAGARQHLPAARISPLLLPKLLPSEDKGSTGQTLGPYGSFALISTPWAGKKLLCPCIVGILRLPCCSKLRERSSSRPNHRLKEWGGSRCCWARISSAEHRFACTQKSGGLSPFSVRKYRGYKMLLSFHMWSFVQPWPYS